MGKLNVVILGDGLMGTEFENKTGWDVISRKRNKIDVKDFKNWSHLLVNYDVVINCIAYTNTYSSNKDTHWSTNVVFLHELINYCNNTSKKLVHISTDYVYSGSNDFASEDDVPVHCNNWYGYTKLVGDSIVQLLCNNFLICRSTHKHRPFLHDESWLNQIGNFDYVDVICDIIVKLINKNINGVINVGTDVKSMFNLAQQTRETNPILSPSFVPINLTMSLDKLKKIL